MNGKELLSFTARDGTNLLDWAATQFQISHLYQKGEISASERDLAKAGFIPATIHGDSE